jgi:cbb3-type cytochrome oxidase cytochrome c subunit
MAANSKDNFRKRVIDPRSVYPKSGMPPHPTFDDDTFNALEAYLKGKRHAEPHAIVD